MEAPVRIQALYDVDICQFPLLHPTQIHVDCAPQEERTFLTFSEEREAEQLTLKLPIRELQECHHPG